MRTDNQRAASSPRRNYVTAPTVVLPGSRGTISGTAINDWLDDDGQPIYGRDDARRETVDAVRC
jgi:hypothetical protein